VSVPVLDPARIQMQVNYMTQVVQRKVRITSWFWNRSIPIALCFQIVHKHEVYYAYVIYDFD
jgi:hypothetical protein